MNTSKSITSVILLSVLSVNLFAQSASGGGGGGTATSVAQLTDGLPSSLPITSQEVLIANAKRLVTEVTSSVGSRGFVYGAKGVNTYFHKSYIPSVPDQPDFKELANLVALANFTFETRNPLDLIDVNVAFRDANGRALFEGSRSFKLVRSSDGNFFPPSQDIKVNVWPAGDLPLEIPGADYVEVSLLNEQGETVSQTRSLERTRSGAFLFPVWLAGQKNVLLTAFDNRDDGTTAIAVYAAQTGTRQATWERSITTSVLFENVVVVPANKNTVVVNNADEQIARAFQNGVSPLVQISFTKPQTFFFYAEHPTEVARGFWIRAGFRSGWLYFSISKGNLTTMELSAGVYDIVIDWPTFGKRQQSFSNDGGKG